MFNPALTSRHSRSFPMLLPPTKSACKFNRLDTDIRNSLAPSDVPAIIAMPSTRDTKHFCLGMLYGVAAVSIGFLICTDFAG